MLAKKVETLTKAMEVEAKKMRREVAAMEKEVAAIRMEKEQENRAKRFANTKGTVSTSQLLAGRSVSQISTIGCLDFDLHFLQYSYQARLMKSDCLCSHQ